jgi:hypothetical protein
MPKKEEQSTRRIMVGVRLTREDADRLGALQARIRIASRHAIAREALRIGLDVLEKDPAARAMDGETKPRSARIPSSKKRKKT